MSIHADRIIAVRTTKIVYLDGDTVVKVFDSDYSKADVLNEAINQARVEETGLPIPKLKAVQMMDGKWTISLAYVEGKKLQQLMVEEPERYDEYLEMFVDLQLTVHHKRVPLLTNMRDKMNRKIEISGLEEEKREALKKTLAALPMRDALCHGDFIPSNIMIDREGRPYILDWSHATQGEPCADAARTYLPLDYAFDERCFRGDFPAGRTSPLRSVPSTHAARRPHKTAARMSPTELGPLSKNSVRTGPSSYRRARQYSAREISSPLLTDYRPRTTRRTTWPSRAAGRCAASRPRADAPRSGQRSRPPYSRR